MKSVDKKIAVWLLMALIIFAAYRGHFFESDLARGKREAARMQELRQEFQKNPNNREALDEIVDYLNGNWAFTRQYAAGTLGQLGPLAKPAVPDLIRALNCGEGVVEREAAIALGTVSVGMPDAVDSLRRKVLESKTDAALFAAESLGEIGKPALVAIPDLEEAAKSPVSALAEDAQKALEKLNAVKEADEAKTK
ncbi:MAG TPA: HEAT repeat domain-containing protein [Pirellulales bacterium]|nr:HEAT repeat domain-containing protein [Pirellulales bacterium]